MERSKLKTALIPVLSVVAGLLVGALIMLVSGFDPVKGYTVLLRNSLGDARVIGETLRHATPLILVALGFATASKAGFFNIGVAGQALVGWLFSVWTAIVFPTLPRLILLPLCLVAGAVAGALWAGIAGALRAFFNTSEVIVTIMLNYTALSVTNYLIPEVLTKQSDKTEKIVEAASLRTAWLSALAPKSTIHLGIFIALAAAAIMWFVMNKTTLGFELKTVGLNKFAAEYAGMSAKKNIIYAMLISGALAGLGGAMEGLGNFGNISIQHALPDIGFDGLAVSLLGAGNPIGIVFSALIFAILRIGSGSMWLLAKIPNEVITISTGVIIFFVGSSYIIEVVLDKFGHLFKSSKTKNSTKAEVK